MENYAALIIDIKKSRSYSVQDRYTIQQYILIVIDGLNDAFSGSLAKNVEFSAGDEVQGLFTSPESAYLYFRIFSMLMFPVEVRAGIGVGEWSVKIENASTTAQDGPVYHNARTAIENVRQATGYYVLLSSGNKDLDLFSNTLINVPFLLTGNHSRYQNELMLLLELLYPICYRQTINLNTLKLLFKIVKVKTETDFYSWYYEKSKSKCIFKEIDSFDFDYIQTDAANEDNTFYVSSGKIRGMATQLSQIINIRRQGVEKTLKTANIHAARDSAIASLKYMGKYNVMR
jgi:hypothetical protein